MHSIFDFLRSFILEWRRPMNDYLYAVKDKENLCKKREYAMLTLEGISLYTNETADDYVIQGYEILNTEQFRTLWDERWAVYESE